MGRATNVPAKQTSSIVSCDKNLLPTQSSRSSAGNSKKLKSAERSTLMGESESKRRKWMRRTRRSRRVGRVCRACRRNYSVKERIIDNLLCRSLKEVGLECWRCIWELEFFWWQEVEVGEWIAGDQGGCEACCAIADCASRSGSSEAE